MALYDRDGVWYVKIAGPDGKPIRHSTGTSDRQKAEEYHDKLKAKLWDVRKLGEKRLGLRKSRCINNLATPVCSPTTNGTQ